MSETRTRIKICGITNLEDARAAIDYGADALGFILVPDSPRYVKGRLDVSRDLAHLPAFISTVGVYRDYEETVNAVGRWFTAIQFYDNSLPRRILTTRFTIRAYRIKDGSSLDEIERTEHEANTLLLDTYHEDKLGGSGETFNWELAVEAKRRFNKPIILAGGLTPENVGDAIAAVRPYAVDVSSGVEAEPGRKDHARLKAFIKAVREANRHLNDPTTRRPNDP